MQISLAPNPFFWTKQQVFDYYDKVAELPIDRVYLGETVCAKRRELRWDDWLTIAEQLEAAGKTVVLSSYTLIEAESEVSMMKRVCLNDKYLVEANDMGAIQLLSEAKRPFVIGSAINVYNHIALEQLVEQGAETWVIPVELSQQRIADLLNANRQLITSELLVHGYLPLAYSARCFAARHHGLPKDDCQWVCQKHPYGIALNTQDNQQLFRINGIQTLSGKVQDLSAQRQQLKELGISRMRISPSEYPIEEVVALCQQGLAERVDHQAVSGFFEGREGMCSSMHNATV